MDKYGLCLLMLKGFLKAIHGSLSKKVWLDVIFKMLIQLMCISVGMCFFMCYYMEVL